MRCAECQAWEMHSDNKEFGYCKAHAPRPEIEPIVEDTQYQVVWPSTGKDDWCCEFRS